MKHIIILGDGMADHAVERLGGKTLLQHADTPNMDMLARMGRCGRLQTVPDGFQPGSEVANTAILGYDLNKVYEGRGPLEAASIGYEMNADDLALRCNIITVGDDGTIVIHHGGHLKTEEGDLLIRYLDEHLAAPVNRELGTDRVHFITGIQYRHLLIIRGGSKHIECAPPHDHPGEPWRPLLVRPAAESPAAASTVSAPAASRPAPAASRPVSCNIVAAPNALSPQQTADLLNDLILRSQALLASHPFNASRPVKANSIWPWGGGYRPQMETLQQLYPQLKTGSVISAVDLIRGIGHYAGLDIIKVPGATGLSDTNYEGKAEAALRALKEQDFVFLHIEASDEAGHDGDLDLKLRTIENLDRRIVGPIYEATRQWPEPVCLAVLPDHPTPVEVRTHVSEPVPFLIYYNGITPDAVDRYDEMSCVDGAYGLLRLQEFMQTLMSI